MKIRKPVEFFYAAYILMKNYLPTLMIEIDENLVKSKKLLSFFYSRITNK
jgi:hypothetical protein